MEKQKPSFSPKEHEQALQFASSLDPKELGPNPSEDFLIAVDPAVKELSQIKTLTIREIQRRLIESPEDLRFADLNKSLETVIKMGRLIQGESTDNLDFTATSILRKLTESSRNDGPTVYEHDAS